MLTFTFVGEKANTVELCNLYEICRCTCAGSFYPLHPVRSSPGTPITTGGGKQRHNSPAPVCRGLCTSTIYQEKFTSETLSATCSTNTQIFKSSMWLQSHRDLGARVTEAHGLVLPAVNITFSFPLQTSLLLL